MRVFMHDATQTKGRHAAIESKTGIAVRTTTLTKQLLRTAAVPLTHRLPCISRIILLLESSPSCHSGKSLFLSSRRFPNTVIPSLFKHNTLFARSPTILHLHVSFSSSLSLVVCVVAYMLRASLLSRRTNFFLLYTLLEEATLQYSYSNLAFAGRRSKRECECGVE